MKLKPVIPFSVNKLMGRRLGSIHSQLGSFVRLSYPLYVGLNHSSALNTPVTTSGPLFARTLCRLVVVVTEETAVCGESVDGWAANYACVHTFSLLVDSAHRSG